MNINQLEYEMFALADFTHPGMRLHQIQKDIAQRFPLSSADMFLQAMKDAIMAKHTPAELTVTEEDVINYHITRVIRLTNKLATALNSRVKENESITNANHITGKL